MNFYNDTDPYVAQWMRNLIAEGFIPPGHVDERSIEDIAPAELAGYTQCHFFAGISGWPLALAIAGFPTNFPIWTGSCPCQPFSTAGAQAGFDDERHLWPAFHWLIQQCQPTTVVGEQVASKVAEPWLDLVCADMEGLGYAFGALAFPSASVGSPQIRDRTFWLGDADHSRLERLGQRHQETQWGTGSLRSTSATGQPTRLACAHCGGWSQAGCDACCDPTEDRNRPGNWAGNGGSHDQQLRVAHPDYDRFPALSASGLQAYGQRHVEPCGVTDSTNGASATNGWWRDADWLACRDGYWRPVEPGTFPLAHGISNRVGRLRAYGNAINPWQAAEFLRAALL